MEFSKEEEPRTPINKEKNIDDENKNTEMCNIPIELDIKNLREHRQKNNNIKLCKLLQNELLQNDISNKDLKKLCNINALKRLLKFTSEQTGHNFTFKEFHDKCKIDPIYLNSVVPGISINSSRQGSKDESTILNACNDVTSKSGIIIEQLPNDSIRPHRHSNKLITKDEYKKGEGDYKKNECLKSLDAKIIGKKEGYIFAKVVLGNGGHQDSVFVEAHNFGEWAHKHGEEGKIYVILIDTDQDKQYEDLKEKFKDKSKIYVVNHIELQKQLIN